MWLQLYHNLLFIFNKMMPKKKKKGCGESFEIQQEVMNGYCVLSGGYANGNFSKL